MYKIKYDFEINYKLISFLIVFELRDGLVFLGKWLGGVWGVFFGYLLNLYV